jgi:hypothetical protein
MEDEPRLHSTSSRPLYGQQGLDFPTSLNYDDPKRGKKRRRESSVDDVGPTQPQARVQKRLKVGQTVNENENGATQSSIVLAQKEAFAGVNRGEQGFDEHGFTGIHTPATVHVVACPISTTSLQFEYEGPLQLTTYLDRNSNSPKSTVEFNYGDDFRPSITLKVRISNQAGGAASAANNHQLDNEVWIRLASGPTLIHGVAGEQYCVENLQYESPAQLLEKYSTTGTSSSVWPESLCRCLKSKYASMVKSTTPTEAITPTTFMSTTHCLTWTTNAVEVRDPYQRAHIVSVLGHRTKGLNGNEFLRNLHFLSRLTWMVNRTKEKEAYSIKLYWTFPDARG